MSITCLIDTGASVSLLHNVVYKQICSDSGRVRLLKPATALFTVSGAPIKVHGKTEVHFKGLGNLAVLVVDGIKHQCIVGDVALAANGAVVDYARQLLWWQGRPLSVQPYNGLSTIDSNS